jgi:hypothetical protein
MPEAAKGPRLWLRRERRDKSGAVTHKAMWFIRDDGRARMYVAPLIAAGTKHPKATCAQCAASNAPPVIAKAFRPAHITCVPASMQGATIAMSRFTSGGGGNCARATLRLLPGGSVGSGCLRVGDNPENKRATRARRSGRNGRRRPNRLISRDKFRPAVRHSNWRFVNEVNAGWSPFSATPHGCSASPWGHRADGRAKVAARAAGVQWGSL